MVFPIFVLRLLGMACKIDTQYLVAEYLAHRGHQFAVDDLLLCIGGCRAHCRNSPPQCIDQLVDIHVLFFRQRQAGVFIDEKTPGRIECLFRIGQDVIYIDRKHDSFQILASMFYLNGHEKRRDIYVALTDMVCFIFQNDVEFTALAEEKAALIRLRESIIFFLVGSERRNSRKFYWNCHGYGFL